MKKNLQIAIVVIGIALLCSCTEGLPTASIQTPTPITTDSQSAEPTQTEEPVAKYEDIGYFKLDNEALGGANRSFTVYTNTNDENAMIEYARSKMWSTGSFTYVHFYNDKEKTPNITMYNPNVPELAYNPENGVEARIFVYSKTPNGNEFAWDGKMSSSRQLN